MDVLETLGVALGLAAMAGINLYLTVFVAGLALKLGWVVLPAAMGQLNVLGDPWIISISGILYFLQFFADKIPWIDTANDAIHTVIRPLGAALLAFLALGDSPAAVKVIAVLLAGGTALTAHLAKAGARLIANTSPEPVSNIGLSLGEDAVVLGGLGLLAWHPVVAFFVILTLIILVWMVLPRLLRAIRAIVWLAWRKLNEAPEGNESVDMNRKLPDACELLIRRAHATTDSIVLAVPCLSGGGPRLPRNLFGWLARFEEGRVFFVSPQWFGSVVVQVPMDNATVQRSSRFMTEKLSVVQAGGEAHVFIFERGHKQLANRVADALLPVRERAAIPALAD